MIVDPILPADDEHARGVTNRVITNSVVSIIAKVIYLVSRLALPPIILSYISLEEYGVWTYCFIVIGYVGMSAMGFSTVFILAGAEYQSTRNLQKLNGMVATGFWLSCGLGVVLLAICYATVPLVVKGLSLPPALSDKAYWLIFGTEISFLLCITIGSLGALIIGLQRIVAEQAIWVASFLLETVMMLVFFKMGLGVYSLLYAFLVRYIFVVLTSTIFSYRWVPGLSLRWQHVNRLALRSFIGYGSVVQLSGFLSMMLRSAEKVIAGWLLNVKFVALLDLGEKFPMMAMSLPSSINGTLIPAAASLHARQDEKAIRDLFLLSTRHVNMFAAFLSAFFLAFAAPLISAWLGKGGTFADTVFVMMIFSVPYHLDVVTGPTSSVLRGCNKPKYELMYPISQFILIGIMLLVGRYFFTDSLALICWIVSMAMNLSALLFMAFGAWYLKVGWREFIIRAIIPGVWLYIIAVAVCQIMSHYFTYSGRGPSLLFSGIGGLIYSMLAMLVFYFLVAEASEKHFILTRLRKIKVLRSIEGAA